MERDLFGELERWKDNPERKPLVLRGARQVGKTWLMSEFGRRCFDDFVYCNFDDERRLGQIFLEDKDPHRIVRLLSMLSGKKILPGRTLIIFDEIQECSEALNSLKYFRELAPEYHVIAAGSLLGTLLSSPKSYPVGMVNLMDLHPMSFSEFLREIDGNLYNFYREINRNDEIPEIFHVKLMERYREYLIIGGMPECVCSWSAHQDPGVVADIQRELLSFYENDFAKHADRIGAGRILLVFRSLVTQLAKSNEKFIYGAVKTGARAREFEEAVEWLVSAGMVLRVFNVSALERPLAAYERRDQFKLFMFDTGLLKQMAELDNRSLLLEENIQFRGPLTENFVLQQLTGAGVKARYFSGNRSELDFLLQNERQVVPLEVKAGVDKSAPSFKNYLRDHPESTGVRLSSRNYRQDDRIINLPLYLAPRIMEFV